MSLHDLYMLLLLLFCVLFLILFPVCSPSSWVELLAGDVKPGLLAKLLVMVLRPRDPRFVWAQCALSLLRSLRTSASGRASLWMAVG